MLRIIEYKIVLNRHENQINEAISSLMREGWEPLGSPFLGGTGSTFVQALVKYDRSSEPLATKGLHYVSASSIDDLTEKVERHLQEGWLPKGGLVTSSDAGKTRFHQTMIH